MTQKISSVNIETATLATISGPTISSIAIANSTYVLLDDTAVSSDGGYAVITGSNFQSNAQVLFGSTSATSVTFVNSSTLRVQVPALTAGSYVVYVQNGDGSTAVRLNGITSSPIPVWSTGSTLTNQDSGTPISISLSATSDSNVTYSVANGSSLPSGTTLAANGLFSGTITIVDVTTYNFSVDAIDTENQEASRSFSVTVLVGDPYYNSTILHLSGQPTSNSWVLDSSTNKPLLTVLGDTRPVAFSPYETVWSNFFDGTGDYLTVPDNTSLDNFADFTIEFWVYLNSVTGTQVVLDKGWNGSSIAPYLIFHTDGATTAYASSNGSSWDVLVGSSFGTLTAGQWYHIALTRSGSSIRLFRNGAVITTVTNGTAIVNGASALGIGGSPMTGANPLNGYISNLRIIKGTAVYTSAFTPSTSPLTAIENTSLLTCQSNRIRDNSTNNFTLTKNGDVTVSTFGPFTETDLVTGSAYFDGTGDYITFPNSSSFAFGTGSFTIEFWIYAPLNNDKFILGGRTAIGTMHITTGGSASTAGVLRYVGSSTIVSSNLITDNAWHHCAIVRNGSTNITLYVDGVSVGTGTDSTNYTTTSGDWKIGSNDSFAGSNLLTGYLSDMRILKGTALYTSNFTPPTSPLTAVANTSFLTLQNRMGENNNRIIDTSGLNNIITRSGNTSQGTFSPLSLTGWSNYFDGTDDSLTFADNNALDLGTGNFTVEAFVFSTVSQATSSGIVAKGGASTGFTINVTGTTVFVPIAANASVLTSSTGAIPVGQWKHVAFTRSGSTVYLFVDGVLVDSTTNTTDLTETNVLRIGTNRTAGAFFDGYISNVRILKGTALYTSNFTPPTSALTAVANTVLLTCQSNRFIDNSSNNFTVTVTGGPLVQPFSPFRQSESWSANTVGGSMYFDGSDFFSTPNISGLNPNTADFVMEAWVYITNTTGSNQGFNGKGTAGTDGYSFFITNGLVLSFIWNGTGGTTITAGTLKLNNWHHVAVVRNSNVIRLYLDGVGAVSSTACTTDITTTGIKYVAQARGSNPMLGYMSNYRMIKGSRPSGYDATSATLTVPTSPLTGIPGTTLLLNGTNAGIIDSTGRINFETFNQTRLYNSKSKYGNTSIYFDGTDDSLLAPYSELFSFGTGQFTIEAWVNFDAFTANRLIFDTYTAASSGGGYQLFWRLTGSSIAFYGNGTVIAQSTFTSHVANTWYHIAVTRDSVNSLRIFVDGTQYANTTYSTAIDIATTAKIGVGTQVLTSTNDLAGYVEDLRVTKGVARYTANFTPSTISFKTR